ncbi:MAG: DoxX family protein [Caulobacter sp.]|nr:DoxX family protein [Caulobacter sp.]
MYRHGFAYGLGAVGLGLVGAVFHDFALQWQPVPPGVPGRAALALLSAAILLVLGLGLFWRRTAMAAAAGLAGVYALWVLALHAPLVAAKPGSVAVWLGVCEISALAAGGAVLAAGPRAGVRLAGQLAFGACALVFGLSHFVYAGFTAQMVPAWLPLPMGWALATGAGHVAAGLAILSGIRARLAATVEAGMMAAFVVLLHAPRVIAQPASQAEWTMLCVALSLTGAAWAVSRSLPREGPSGALTLAFPIRQTGG